MVKQIHAPGSGGRSDYHSLNGKELRRWTKQRRVEQLLTPAASPSHPEILPNVPILERWISQLGLLLLSKDEFDRRSFGSLSMLVDEIHQHWTGYTKDTIFPKLHMLYHAISFAEKHGALGKYSEAAMESCHAQLNPIIHHSGRNQGKNTEERLRRALADSATAQMQAVLIERGKLI